jgi:hypothetical protein
LFAGVVGTSTRHRDGVAECFEHAARLGVWHRKRPRDGKVVATGWRARLSRAWSAITAGGRKTACCITTQRGAADCSDPPFIVDGRVDRMGFTAKLYTCGVCLEDSLSYRDMAMCFAGCGHRLCTTCAKAYIESKVRDGALHIQCQDMSAGRRCPSLIRTAVIWQVCGDATFAAYEKNLAANHAQRAAELMRDAKAGKDMELITWLHDNTRKCPLCSVIIYRHGGCDHMSCKCGHAFNWAVAPMIELPPAVQEERQRAAREEEAAAAAAAAATEAKSQIFDLCI